MVNFQLQFVEKTPKQNDLYKVIGLEEEVGELELVIWDKEKFLEERPNYRNISEEEQYKFETLTSRLRCVWHNAKEVVDKYYQLHKEGKTTNALLAGLKSGLNEYEQRQRAANETIISMGESVQRSQEIIIEIENLTNTHTHRERERGRVIYNENGVRIYEDDMERISKEYFRGDSLENVQFDWQEGIREIINDVNLPSYLLNSGNSLALPTLQQLKTNAGSNIIPLMHDTTKLIFIAINFKKNYNKLDNLQKERLERETKLRNWVLETATKHDNLKNKIETDPKLISISYKIETGEEISWFYVVTNHFNNRFGVNWSSLELFSFLIGGLFGLIWLGYWFISQVKSVVRRRNTDNRENNHQD